MVEDEVRSVWPPKQAAGANRKGKEAFHRVPDLNGDAGERVPTDNGEAGERVLTALWQRPWHQPSRFIVPACV
jgi:hypothetical protein